MNIWSLLGLAVGIAAGFCIMVMEVFQDKTYYQSFRWYACGTLAAGGLLLLLLGKILKARGMKITAAAIPAVPGTQFDPPEIPVETRVASHFAFWGPLMVVFGAIVFFIPYKEKERVVAAREVKAEPKPPEPQSTSAPPTVEVAVPEATVFPKLKIQGFVYRPPNSAIIIDGKSFFAGDSYENAEIISISASSVTLEVNGLRSIVLIDKSLRPR